MTKIMNFAIYTSNGDTFFCFDRAACTLAGTETPRYQTVLAHYFGMTGADEDSWMK